MAVINVDVFTQFENELDVALVNILKDKNKKYNYCISFTHNSTKKTSCFCSDSEIAFTINSSNTIVVQSNSGFEYLGSTGSHNSHSPSSALGFNGINAGTDVFVREALFKSNIPVINSSNNLGDMLIFKPFTYSIAYTEGINLSVTEKIGDIIIRNFTTSNGMQITCDIGSNFNDLSYGKHAIKIIINASQSNELVEKGVGFNKIKAPITPIPTDSTLTQAINHMIELNKEIDYQEIKLNNNLVSKGVEVLPTDKMSNLIDKVGSIPLGKKWASGELTSSTSKSFTQADGTSKSFTYIRIPKSSIGFVPNLILVSSLSYGNISVFHNLYNKEQTERPTISNASYGKVYAQKYTTNVKGNDLVISDLYYDIPLSTGGSGTNYEWIAYE